MKAHSNISLVYTKYGYRLSVLGGPIALHGLVHFPNTTGASLTKVVYAYFDGISYTLKGFPKRKMHLFNRLIILWWCFTSSWGFVIFALSIPVGDTRTPTHDTKIGYQRKKSRQNHHLMLHWMVKTMVSCDFSPKSRPNKVKSMPPKVLRCDSWSYRSTAVGEKHMQAVGQNPVTFRMKVSYIIQVNQVIAIFLSENHKTSETTMGNPHPQDMAMVSHPWPLHCQHGTIQKCDAQVYRMLTEKRGRHGNCGDNAMAIEMIGIIPMNGDR